MSLALYEPSIRWLAFVGLLTCQWLLGLSAACAAGDDPRSRLARMHSAAHERNYQGTMVFTTAGVVSSSRVGHFTVGDQSYERIEALDGRMQKIYRHNDAVHTLWPQSGVMVIEKRGAADARALLMQTVEPGALDQYELKPEGQQRVAGRDAEVFLLQPRDELRYAQRLWADVASGLMLRADVINSARQVLESSAFSEVEIGVKAQPESVLQPLRKASSYKVLRANNEPTHLDEQLRKIELIIASSNPALVGTAYSDQDLNSTATVTRGQFFMNFNAVYGAPTNTGTSFAEGVARSAGVTPDGVPYSATYDDGADRIFGDLGNDWIVGGTGRDTS